ncbi:hypothetical protein SAMN05421806_102337 [Streptomyces indicus]|uniref:Calcium-binding protein n=1 Tax=Streptomyces indicus TaxID=417292 RepID=A0A1G8WAH7_9ACTN|nr:hypothetical protein SAMN05421806_102337 [Streptomyces indicus]
MAGGAAAVFTAVAAAPAGAAENGISFSRVTVNKGKAVVVGVANEVEVPASFRMTAERYWDSAHVYLYRGSTSSSNELWHSLLVSSDCDSGTRGACDFTETLTIDPAHGDFGNEYAGAWKVAGRAYLAGDAEDTDAQNLTVHVKRNSHLTVNASPEPVAKGRTITVTGKITRANWDTNKYAGYGGRHVNLQFKPAGATSFTTVKMVYADSAGGLRTTVKADRTGTWRWAYYGNSTTGVSYAPGDHVVVQ